MSTLTYLRPLLNHRAGHPHSAIRKRISTDKLSRYESSCSGQVIIKGWSQIPVFVSGSPGYAIAVLIQIVAYGLIALALGLVMRLLWGDIAGTIGVQSTELL